MRLKFLFFPIILVVSVAIFASLIWPAIGEVKKINEDRLAKNAELEAVKEKKVAIETVGRKISDNADGENIVNNYLPENKTEERIIGGINYLASDANVSLVNISLSDAKAAPVAVNNSALGVASEPGASLIDPVTGNVIANNANQVQSTEAKISLVGDYEKIRIFLDSLQRMPVFNTIRSVNITRQGEKTASTEGGAVSSALLADISIDFGYLSTAKVNAQQVEKLKTGLDNETISLLKNYVSQKSQSLGGDSQVKGKANPFVIN